MDWSTLFSGLMGNQAQPAGGAPGMPVQGASGPTSYGGPDGPQPVGVLNGQQDPAKQQQALLTQAQALMKPPAAPPPMQPIQQARPVGAQGIDPMKLLAAMQQNKLMNA